MSYLAPPAPPRNLCDLLLRDVASLLITSHLVSRSVKSLRREHSFSRELAASLDTIAATSDAGELLLHPPLTEAGAVLPLTAAARESEMLTDFFIQLPGDAAPGVLAAEISSNLRLLARHIEFKARLAAEEAVLVGQNALCHALMIWAAEWRACGHALRTANTRARAQAYVADIGEFVVA